MRLGAALGLAGAALILLLSMISYEVRGKPFASADGPVARIDAQHAVIQRMAIETIGLRGFEIKFIPQERVEPLTLTLRLQVADSGLPDLARVDHMLSPALTTPLRFDFPALTTRLAPYAITSTLDIIIEASSLSATTNLALIGGSAAISTGSLQVGAEQSSSIALSITPLYQRRLFDLIWPISAMASGRPGIFGWPPLYPLVVYGYLLSLSYAAAALRRRLQIEQVE